VSKIQLRPDPRPEEKRQYEDLFHKYIGKYSEIILKEKKFPKMKKPNKE
jgi:hypothetical protein